MTGKRFLFKVAPLKFFFFIVFAAAAVLVLGGIVMWLWNAILPDLLNINRISYWQSVGLLVLSKILFGSFGAGRGRTKQMAPWAHSRARFMNMTEEEKKAFKEEMRKRCSSR